MLLKLWRMGKNVFSWRPQATKCHKFPGGHLIFMETRIEATEVPHCTFGGRAQQKLTGFFTGFFNGFSHWVF